LKLADLLRDKMNITEITFYHVRRDGTTDDVLSKREVPARGEKWYKEGDIPTAADIQAATLALVREHFPASVQPAFMYVVNRDSAERGFTITVTNTAPYTSNLCCIESKWSDGKGYVAKAENQKTGRSPAEVVKLLIQKWYTAVLGPHGELRAPVHPRVYVNHCHKEMNKLIARLQMENPPDEPFPCTLTGDIFNLGGIPTDAEGWEDWRSRAGVKQYGSDFAVDATFDDDIIDGKEREEGQEGEEEGDGGEGDENDEDADEFGGMGRRGHGGDEEIEENED
jgi:hypothetical protein